MKIIVIAIIVALVAGSLYADYKWRQWMTARKPQRNGHAVGDPARRHDRNDTNP